MRRSPARQVEPQGSLPECPESLTRLDPDVHHLFYRG